MMKNLLIFSAGIGIGVLGGVLGLTVYELAAAGVFTAAQSQAARNTAAKLAQEPGAP